MQISAPQRATTQEVAPSIAYSIGASLLIAAFGMFVLDVLSLGAGLSIAAWQGIVGGLIGIGWVSWQQRSRFGVVLLFVGVFGMSLILSGICYDISWDGQTYHQEAILQLAQGWNPFYQVLGETNLHGIWLDHYTKASWYLAANLYRMTGQLETAKAFNLILLLSSLWLSVAALRSTTSRVWLIATLLALNPVVISQAFNFTIDGQVASLLLCLGASLYAIALRPDQMRLWLPVVISSMGLLINIKFTALAYAGIFGFGCLGWLWFKHRHQAVKLAIVLLFSIGISIVGLGYQPYVSNTLSRGHPFYPLAGVGKIDIISAQIPVDFVGKNRVEKFLRSTFAESDAARNTTSKLKFPLLLKRQEFVAMLDGTRVGGFGPWFAAALIAGAIAVRPFQPDQLTIVGIILASALINPEAWWARYVPQIWLLAPLALLKLNPKKLALPQWIFILVLSLNCVFVIAPNAFGTVRGNWIINQQIQQLSNVQKVAVNFDTFEGNRSRFIERSIEWEAVKILPCSQPTQFFKSNTRFCVLSK